MQSHGKIFLAVMFLGTFLLGASGCQFFGKQTPAAASAPGQLTDGTSFVGSWSTSYSDISTSDVPTVAATTTFTLDGSGGLQVTTRNQLGAGGTCVGSGQYRLVGQNNLVLYVQAVQPTTCVMTSQMQLSNVQVASGYLSYTDPTNNGIYHLFADHAQPIAPVGVWKFGGAAGIDYLFLDAHGYFILQTTIGSDQYLLQGYYNVIGGGISLFYFNNGDPTQVIGSSIFSSFVTNGQTLELVQTTSTGDVTIDGSIL